MEIHQLLSGFRTGDAISNYALELKNIFTGMGFTSHIYVVPEHVCPDLKKLSRPLLTHREVSNKENILVYHFSLGSKATDYFKEARDKKMVIYHNITPAKFLRGIDSQQAKTLDDGRGELRELVPFADIALGVSGYNREELIKAGFKRTGILPLIVSHEYLNTRPSATIIRTHNKKTKKFLSVGRIVPNKKIEDIIKIFYFYKKTINPYSQLVIIGGYEGMEKYYGYLKTLLIELNLPDVVFTKHVPLPELISHYRTSSAFLCMSEHEGFCLPLLEAMYFDLPVFAFNSSAIPETLQGSGILIKEKNFSSIAELVNEVLENKTVRDGIIAAQRERIAKARNIDLKKQLADIINSFTASSFNHSGD